MKKIGLFGPYGFGNMGDVALVESAKLGLLRNIRDVEFCAICQHPKNAAIRHNMPAYPIYSVYPKSTDLKTKNGDSELNARDDVNSVTSGNNKEKSILVLVKSYIKSIKILYLVAKNIKKSLQPVAIMMREIMFLLNSFKLLRKLDIIVMPGSGQLNEEWGGAWRYPFALFKWCLLARLAGCKIAFLSIGSGTVDSIPAKFFCKWALKLAHYKSFRDPETKRISDSFNIKSGQVLPDLAFSLRSEIKTDKANGFRKQNLLIGINPIAYCDPRSWYLKDAKKYNEYINKIAKISDQILEMGYHLLFIPNEIRMDNWVIDDIIFNMSSKYKESDFVQRADISNPLGIINAIDKCDYIFASRFHGLLFSYLLAKPTIAISFHYKLSLLSDDVGQKAYCLPIETFSVLDVINLFESLVDNSDDIVNSIKKNTADYAQMLEKQFKSVANLLGV